MEISNDIMLMLIAAMWAIVESLKKIYNALTRKKEVEPAEPRTLTHEEHDWLRLIADNHDPRNPQSLINQMTDCKKISSEILELTKSNRGTLEDLHDKIFKG